MVEKLALKLTDFLCTEDYNNTKDRAKIQYGLSILLSEGLKIIFLVILFNLIHHQYFFYFSLLILLTIRTFAGGLHIKGTFNCLLLTTLLFIFTSILAPLIPSLAAEYYLLAAVLNLFILLFRAPICSVRRPIKDNKKKLQYKITAMFMTALWSIILLHFSSSALINCGFSTIILQNLQLLLVKKSLASRYPTSTIILK